MGKLLFWVGVACIGAMAQGYPITVNVQGMTEHIGQGFKMRLVETPSGIQRAETTMVSLTVADFQIGFTGESGKNYNLDYYADGDGTRSYTAPPRDHAWRKSVVAPHHGGVTVDASHDLNFTDIRYPDAGSPVRRTGGARGKAGTAPWMISVNLEAKDREPGRRGYTLLGKSSRAAHQVLVAPSRASGPNP